jgi:hypothetical protein
MSSIAASRRGTCAKRHSGSRLGYAGRMSEGNGDRARFHKNRTRKLHHRQLIAALVAKLRPRADEHVPSVAPADSGDRSGAARQPADRASQGEQVDALTHGRSTLITAASPSAIVVLPLSVVIDLA